MEWIDLNEINAHPVESEIVTPIMQAFNRIKELEIQVSDLSFRLETTEKSNLGLYEKINYLEEIIYQMQCDLNDIKEMR